MSAHLPQFISGQTSTLIPVIPGQTSTLISVIPGQTSTLIPVIPGQTSNLIPVIPVQTEFCTLIFFPTETPAQHTCYSLTRGLQAADPYSKPRIRTPGSQRRRADTRQHARRQPRRQCRSVGTAERRPVRPLGPLVNLNVPRSKPHSGTVTERDKINR